MPVTPRGVPQEEGQEGERAALIAHDVSDVEVVAENAAPAVYTSRSPRSTIGGAATNMTTWK
jgi:hypothetical protein